MSRPVTAGLRINSSTPGHTQVSVFVGRNPGARAHAGVLTFRTDEFNELGSDDFEHNRLVISFDWIPREAVLDVLDTDTYDPERDDFDSETDTPDDYEEVTS